LRVAVPIPDAAGVWGVLYVETTKESLVGSYSLGILQAMAAQAGLAIAKLSMEPSVRSTVAPGEAARSPERFGELSSVGAPMLAAFAQLRGIAAAMAPVLLQGESGTGKELAARAIHSLSSRSSQPFVAIDCGAIPETLAEAELFGCVRGAFSGATEPRPGLIATSHRGTLFLDEVGNMPFALQAKLLRVLQTGEVRAVGAVGCRTVDFRLVSATNSDLEAEVRAGRFRPDLYYRLAGLVVRLPPLRERRADIVHLATQILEEARGEHERSSTTLSRDAVSHLVGHDWPGNVRELHHAVAAARALAGDGPILGDHIARAIQPTPLEGSEGVAPRRDEDQLALIAALAATNGDKTAAARRLGWSRMRVYRVLRRSSNTFDVRTQ
jgi:transcriptional regulator with GAF, ATPase, and Fis domain